MNVVVETSFDEVDTHAGGVLMGNHLPRGRHQIPQMVTMALDGTIK